MRGRGRPTGEKVVRELEYTAFGSHTFSVRDPEGNHWTFGTYRGAA